MGLAENLKAAVGWPERTDPVIGMQGWLQMIEQFTYNGVNYPLNQQTSYGTETAPEIGSDYTGMVQGAYKANGVVFACMVARQMLFSEARFMFRKKAAGVNTELHRTASLKVLEQPWANGTTGNLLSQALLDVDLTGNFYGVRRRGQADRIVRARPDWIAIVFGSPNKGEVLADDLDAELMGYLFYPGGPRSGRDPIPLLPDEVAHFAPIPDPQATFRGASPLTSIITEIQTDGAATRHKLKFFEHGGTPNLVVNFDKELGREAFEKWVALFERDEPRATNAYKTMYLGGGTDAKVIGTDLRQLDLSASQGAGEVRICNAFRVPPIIVGVEHGLDSATYSNINQAVKIFADGTMRPLWRDACGSFESIITVPRNEELWYDARDIAWLKEDSKALAEIQQVQSAALKSAVEAGFDPESAVKWILADDPSQLKHTGLTSVQLLPPGTKVFEPSGSVPSAQTKPEQGAPGAPAAKAPTQNGTTP